MLYGVAQSSYLYKEIYRVEQSSWWIYLNTQYKIHEDAWCRLFKPIVGHSIIYSLFNRISTWNRIFTFNRIFIFQRIRTKNQQRPQGAYELSLHEDARCRLFKPIVGHSIVYSLSIVYPLEIVYSFFKGSELKVNSARRARASLVFMRTPDVGYSSQ